MLRFNTVLDSKKTGLKVKTDVYRSDKRDYDRELPECLKPASDQQMSGNGRLARNSPTPFILDTLLSTGRTLKDEHLARYESLQTNPSALKDQDLRKPVLDARSFARKFAELGFPQLSSELHQIEEHVAKHMHMWQEACGRAGSSSAANTPSKFSSTKSPQKLSRGRTDDFRQVTKSFAEMPSPPLLSLTGNVDAIKASFAYELHRNPNFALSMAFKDLCDIKAKSAGSAALTRAFADAMSTTSSGMRILQRSKAS